MQDPEKVKDPVEFVQQLLTQKDKFDAIVLRSFQNDKAFQNALNQAFEHFINLNQRSPEYISLFMDDKLRKGLKVGGQYVIVSGSCVSRVNFERAQGAGVGKATKTLAS
jgi:Cullin family